MTSVLSPVLRRPSTAEDRELAELVTRISRSDAAAFAEFYDRTSPRINGLVLRIIRTPDQGAEVLQEIYLQVWHQASRFDCGRGSAWAWVMTLAHRRTVDRVRASEASSVRDHRFASAHYVRDVDQVWEDVARRVDARTVRDALLRLTPIQREALTLAYFDGRSTAEIAAELEIAVGMVKTRIRDAIIGLRRELTPA